MVFGDYKWGDTGAGVEEMQRSLSMLGYKVAVDGNFGNETYAAVRQFQADHGLAVDGIIGPNTVDALANALVAGESAPPVSIPAPAPTPVPAGPVLTAPLTSKSPGLSPALVLGAAAAFGAWYFLIRGAKGSRLRLT